MDVADGRQLFGACRTRMRCGTHHANAGGRPGLFFGAAKLEALPAEYCETLVRRDSWGLDDRAIATITGTPVGNVMSCFARARRQRRRV